MRPLLEDIKTLMIICLLLLNGPCADSFNDTTVLANSTLAMTTEELNVQTIETTSEASTASTSFPVIPTSTASAARDPGEDITTDSEITTLNESEMITTQSPAQKNSIILTDSSNISPPNALPALAARNAPKQNDPVPLTTSSPPDSTAVETTSAMDTPTRLSTDLTTSQEVEETTSEQSVTVTTAEGPDSTTYLHAITNKFDATPNLDEATTNLAEAETNIEEATTNLAEISANLAHTVVVPISSDVTADLGETTMAVDVTTGIAIVKTNLATQAANLAERTTQFAASTTNLPESVKNGPESITNLPESTTNLPEAMENLPESTTNLPESTTNLAEVTSPPESTTNSVEMTTDSKETTTNLTLEAASTDLPETTSRAVASTRSSASKEHMESNEISSLTWFILILDGNCTHLARGRQGQRESGLKRQIIQNLTSWLDAPKEDVSIPAGVVCTPEGRVHANLTLVQTWGSSANISGRLKSLEDMKAPLFRFHGQEFYVYQILTADGFFNKEPDIPVDLRHTDVELLVYISVGATCAFLFLLAMALLGCKYCTCREQKPFEFGDPQNANLRLEDYTLTRIPRPKVGYVEYCRGITKRYCPLDDRGSGMVQPFDTSVVPLEDARAHDFRDGVIVRPTDIRSLGRAYHTGCCGGYRPAGYATDADGYCVHSTENLHRPHKVDRYVDKGVDNPNFY